MAARGRIVAVSACVAAMLALVTWFAWESRDDALAPGAPTGQRERGVASVIVDVAPEPTEASVAREAGGLGIDDAGRSVLRGLVLDEAGTPVADASVEAVPEQPAATERAASATRPDGTFDLGVLDVRCTHRLRVQAEGFYPAFVESLVPGGAPVTIRLRAAPSLRGRVDTTAGLPITGARVRLLARTEFGDALEFETRSDERGRYRLAAGLLDLENLEDPILEASAAGFAPSRVHVRELALLVMNAPTLDAVERDLVLSVGNRVTGRAVDEAGAPIAGAEVVVFTHAGRDLFTDPSGTLRNSPLGPTAILTTHSAHDGGFALEGLPVRTADGAARGWEQDDDAPMGSVRVRAQGFALGGAPLPWTTEGAAPPPLEIVLARGASFSGRVVDGRGQPLGAAKIAIGLDGASLATIVLNGMQPEGYGDLMFWPPVTEGARSYLWVRANSAGHFRSPVLPCWGGGAVRGRVWISWRGETGEPRELELVAGEHRDLGDLPLELNHAQIPIEGVVLDSEGAPVAGAEVELHGESKRRTDSSGVFRFEYGLAPDDEFPALDLEVRARGFVTHREALSARPMQPLEVGMVAGREVRGTLLFQDGTPVARGWIAFERPPEPNRGWVFSDSIGVGTSDADGHFAFAELPAPPWRLRFGVRRAGFEPSASLTLQEPTQELELVLPALLPDFASLELVVTDGGSRSIEELSAPELVNGALRTYGVRRDARTFAFPDVAPGAYELRLAAPGFAVHTQQLELLPGERKRVDVGLESGARVLVRVAPPLRTEMRLHVAAVSADSALKSGLARSDGVADLGVLAPGTWTVGLVGRMAASGDPAWLAPPVAHEVPLAAASLEWNLERPALGLVRLELPVHGADDPPVPARDSLEDSGALAAGDQHQAWWSAYTRYARRARGLTLELRDDAGTVLLSTSPDDVELDAARNRVLGVLTAPAGRYTLVLRNGTQVLRSTSVHILSDSTIDLDP